MLLFTHEFEVMNFPQFCKNNCSVQDVVIFKEQHKRTHIKTQKNKDTV